MRIAYTSILILGLSTAPFAQTSAPAVIPRPVSMTPRAGVFRLTAQTIIVAERADSAAARRLARDLAPATGFDLPVRYTSSSGGNRIVFRHAAARDTSLGAEGYRLEVTPGLVTITSSAPAGAFYATQTIKQLLPAAIFRDAPIAGVSWTIPAVSIVDRPRFTWRGMHLDVARHFMPKEFVKKYIDLLALHKLNTFHWHLTEDQGWRLEIKEYPKLTEVGSCRKETILGRYTRDASQWKFDGTPHCGFYTQDDAREIVAYAKARFITVVPEIEMPGHAVAAIAAYPELGVTGEPIDVAGRWGIFSDILNAEPSTITFMQNVLTEVMAIFPSRYIHIGGDEADKAKWKTSPRIQARIKELGLKDEHELQSWFIRQMDAFLSSQGRRLIGWDEILEGGLAENAVVMSWRGVEGGVRAARAKHDVVMAPTTHTYLDYYPSKDRARDGLAIGGFLPLEMVYSYEPIPAELEPEFAKHVLGAQAQLWTEYMPTPKRVEYMAFPRLTALAEVVWTPKEKKDYSDYLQRLEAHLRRLSVLDVNFRPLD
jgi:hexosaminidase